MFATTNIYHHGAWHQLTEKPVVENVAGFLRQRQGVDQHAG